jgi:hypothetical protein
MSAAPISRYPVPKLEELPQDIRASNRVANMISLRPNDEFYLMGRVPKGT